MDVSTDHELMLAVQNGAIEKLGVLFERHHKALYHFFLRLTGRPDVSEDLVQEVFYRILKFRTTFRGESKFTTWMYQIARNVCVDHFRKNRHQIENLDQLEYVSDPTLNPENEILKNDNIILLQRALQKLPAEKREVLILSRYQNLKYEEIAQILNCKLGTVKAKVFRAIQDLTRIYYELAGETE